MGVPPTGSRGLNAFIREEKPAAIMMAEMPDVIMPS
jgi:hypothetical protein